MNASSNDIRTNSDKSTIYEDRGWKRSDPVPDHIYDIHMSLVEEEVIIRSEIISCSKQFISKIEKDRAIKFSSKLGSAIKIGINLEGSFKEKRIQKKQLKQICIGLHAMNKSIKIVILSSPKKATKVKEIINELELNFVFASYLTNTINDLAALVEQLDIVITPDTSIVHIAGAFDKPVISIHENNQISFRLWAPISSLRHTVFAKSDYGIFGYSVDEIIDSAKDMLTKMELD